MHSSLGPGMVVTIRPMYGQRLCTTSIAGAAGNALEAQQQHSEAGGRAIAGSSQAMTSPFSAWSGGSDGESQVNQARMKALDRRKKSHKKVALEVVKEADKEGEEGGFMLHIVNSSFTAATGAKQAHNIRNSHAEVQFCMQGHNCLH